jgi:hypothetical protein
MAHTTAYPIPLTYLNFIGPGCKELTMMRLGTTGEVVAIVVGIITILAALKSFYNGWLRDRILAERERKTRRNELDEKIDEIYDTVKHLEEAQEDFAEEQQDLKQATYFLALAEDDEVEGVDPERIREVLGVPKGLQRFSSEKFPFEDD